MTTSDKREEFLAGERPEEVALFLADSYVSDDRLATFGERIDDGVLIIVDGERGRNAFQAATGTGAMEFAGGAMKVEGEIDGDLTGGVCPEEGSVDVDEQNEDGDTTEAHHIQFVFAFAEEQNEEVGGRYADSGMVHAYAQCTCGTAYSDRWSLEE